MFKASKNIVKLAAIIALLFYFFPQTMNGITQHFGLTEERDQLFSVLPVDTSKLDDIDRETDAEENLQELMERASKMRDDGSAWTGELAVREKYSRSECADVSNGMPVISVSNAKVYTSPSNNGRVMGTFPGLSKVAVTSIPSRGWYQVVTSGTEPGYVKARYVYMPDRYLSRLKGERL